MAMEKNHETFFFHTLNAGRNFFPGASVGKYLQDRACFGAPKKLVNLEFILLRDIHERVAFLSVSVFFDVIFQQKT